MRKDKVLRRPEEVGLRSPWGGTQPCCNWKEGIKKQVCGELLFSSVAVSVPVLKTAMVDTFLY